MEVMMLSGKKFIQFFFSIPDPEFETQPSCREQRAQTASTAVPGLSVLIQVKKVNGLCVLIQLKSFAGLFGSVHIMVNYCNFM